MGCGSSVLLSFIIPCYNAEKYIQRCLDSIFDCGLPEEQFEVICVDDCSSDATCEKIDQFRQDHANLFLLRHDVNKKAGGARNTGLLAAHGLYVWYVDADDAIVSGAATSLLEKCFKDSLDTLCFNSRLVFKDGFQKDEIVFENSIVESSGLSFLEKVFGKNIIFHLGFPWRTIYRRELLLNNNILFPEGLLFGEETTYMVEAISYANNAGSISDVLYEYRQNDSGSSASELRQYRGDLVFQSVFCAGELILKMYDSILPRSVEVADNIRSGLPWFVNRLFVSLIRTSHRERNLFYRELHELRSTNSSVAKAICGFMDYKNKFVTCCPILGGIMLDILSCAYKIKHRQ